MPEYQKTRGTLEFSSSSSFNLIFSYHAVSANQQNKKQTILSSSHHNTM
jgi:hypothetical protein